MKKRAKILMLLLSLAVFVSDQATKLFVIRNVAYQQVINIAPFFNIVYYRNTGSAFGMFKDLGNLFFIGISCIAIVVMLAMIYREGDEGYSLALILGGAAGNLADRIIHGYVIDFLEVYAGKFYWPAFNVADSALSVGIFFLVLRSLFRKSDA